MKDIRLPLPTGENVAFSIQGSTFYIQGEKGRGGSCIVYNARLAVRDDQIQNRPVLLKEFYPSDYQSILRRNPLTSQLEFLDSIPSALQDSYQKERSRFLTECEQQRLFYQRNAEDAADELTDLQDVYVFGESVYSVMAAASGVSWDQTSYHSESLFEVLETLRSVLKELDLYHKSGFLHCDIKPANIYLFRKTRQHVRLLDFGSVQKLCGGRLDEIHTLSYSLEYAAPELRDLEDADEIDFKDYLRCITTKADLYSAAAVLYEKLCGRQRDQGMPDGYFQEELQEELERLWTEEKNRWLKNVRHTVIPALNHFLSQGLAQNPKDRFDLPSMQTALEELLLLAEPQKIRLSVENAAPDAAAEFIGRESELSRLKDMVLSNHHAVFICGDGGLGKSELALKLAQELRGEFDFYRTTFSNDLTETMLNLLVEPPLRQTNSLPESETVRQSQEEQYDYHLRCLQSYGSTSVLIIDNFDVTPERENEIFHSKAYSDFMGLRMKLLFTSRKRPPLDAACLDLECMSENDLLRLIHSHYKAEGTPEVFRELIRLSAYNTLVVELAAKALEQSWGRLMPEHILNLFSSRSEMQNKDSGLIYTRIRQLFDVTLLSRESRRLMAQASLFPAGGINAGICLMCHSETDQDKLRLLELNGWLRKTPNNLLTVHPLVQNVCRNELPERDEACEAFLKSYELQYAGGHIPQEIQMRTRQQCVEVFSNAADYLSDPQGFYAEKAGACNYEFGRYQPALKYNQAAYAVCQSQPENLWNRSISLLDRIACCYKALGAYNEAVEYLSQAIFLREQLGEEAVWDLANYYSNLGATYNDQGNYKDALDAFSKAEQLYSGHQVDYELAHLYVNLCKLYQRFSQYHLARQYAQRVFDSQDCLQGMDTRLMFASLYKTMGIMEETEGNYGKALRYYEQSINIFETVCGEDSHQTASGYLDKGILLTLMKQYDQALEFLERCRKIYEECYGREHSSVANCWHSLGQLYRAKGEYSSALYWTEKAEKIREKVLDHRNTAMAKSYEQHAAILYEMGWHLEDALSCYFRAFMIYHANFVSTGGFARECEQALYNLRLIYQSTGRNPSQFQRWLEQQFEHFDSHS